MTRQFCTISTQIWNDPPYGALSVKAQWTLFMLATQPEVSAVGVLPLTTRRWARHTPDLTPQHVEDAIAELDKARVVAVDTSTDEVAVLPFVRWDNGYLNSKRRSVILRGLREVRSQRICRALMAELVSLGVDLTDEVDGTAALDSAPLQPLSERRHAREWL